MKIIKKHRYHKYYHKCDTFPNDPLRAITVDTKTNWAWDSADPQNSGFPIYKECCHFFKIKKNGECGHEVDMTTLKPKIIK